MKHKRVFRAFLIALAILTLVAISPAAGSAAAGSSEQPPKSEAGDAFVGSFSVFFYSTYLLNPEGPMGQSPDNVCRGFHIGSVLRKMDYDIVALAETFDGNGRKGLWDQVNASCVEEGSRFDNPSGGISQCKYPAWVLNQPSASDSACGRECTETGGLSLLSKYPLSWDASSGHTKEYQGGDMCRGADCRAGKGFIRAEVKNIGGMHAVNLQIYMTQTQSRTPHDPCEGSNPNACGPWVEVRERQIQALADHSREHVREGDGPILYLGDFNIPARDFSRENIHRYFQVYEKEGDYEYDTLLGILNSSGPNSQVRDAFRELNPPPSDSQDPDQMIPYFTFNPTWNHLAAGPWHGRIDYQLIDDSRSCYRLVPRTAEHVDLLDPSCDTGGGDSLSNHFGIQVTYDVYRRADRACNYATPPPVLNQPVPALFPEPYGPGMALSWSEPANPGLAFYEIQVSEDGGANWESYATTRSSSPGPRINHLGHLPCREGYQYCLGNSREYSYRVRALDSTRAPITEWSNVMHAVSLKWAELRTISTSFTNPGFQAALICWDPYEDGTAGDLEEGWEGSYSASISRAQSPDSELGLWDRSIPCEPTPVYRLTPGIRI
jgi:hypothetical protein